ncbi:ComF family protein [Chromobacterium haemolyticum]|uniref:ComF family protein n=1 Tax=Chromobacterium haemolyticum TaxID=394935 RepID=UPI0009F01CF0|nr:amidophosphoribosyltransferase [Chromobacterium haemolyticum]
MLSNLTRLISDKCTIFNQPCLLCGDCRADRGFCQDCRRQLPALPSAQCARCAEPLPVSGLCGQCQRRPPAFDALYAPYLFDYPLAALIHAFKYGKQLQMGAALGGLLADFALPLSPKYHFVIPVPLAKERLAERGFNQSHELAKAFAATMASRLSAEVCWRKYNTPPQASLGRVERRKNLRHAFGVNCRCDGLSIAIVDDVATSGATLSALAEILKKQGAKRVDGWVLARAFSPKT